MKLQHLTAATPRYAGKPAAFQATPQPLFGQGPEQTDNPALARQVKQNQKQLAIALLAKVSEAVRNVLPNDVKADSTEQETFSERRSGYRRKVPYFTIPFGNKSTLDIGLQVVDDITAHSAFYGARGGYEVKAMMTKMFLETPQAQVILPLNYLYYHFDAPKNPKPTQKTLVNHFLSPESVPTPEKRLENLHFLLDPTNAKGNAVDLSKIPLPTFSYETPSKQGNDYVAFNLKDAKVGRLALDTVVEAFQVLNEKVETARAQREQSQAQWEAQQATRRQEKLAKLPTLVF